MHASFLLNWRAMLRSCLLRLAFVGASVSWLGCAESTSIVRTRAAHDFSCPEDEIQIEKLTPTTYVATGCGHTSQFTCVGTGNSNKMTCVHDDPVWENRPISADAVASASAATAEPAEQAPAKKPPVGAGGFDFGMSDSAARDRCTKAGHNYQPVSPSQAICDGVPVEVGVPATAQIQTCAGAVCVVALDLKLGPNEDVAHSVIRWRNALTDKYGAPTSSESDVPSNCDVDIAALSACVTGGRAKIRVTWEWSSGHRVSLFPHGIDGKLGVRLIYSSKDVATKDVVKVGPGL
jgi:hypothetical protein